METDSFTSSILSNVESQRDSFNWNAYINNYPDLRKLTTPTDAWNHYNRFGKNEGRTDCYTYKSHPYYTHQPFFKEVLKNTTGNILECGCGQSTLFIKECIEGTDRKLVTLESDAEWLKKYTHLKSDLHELYQIDATNDDTDENAKKWVDFIDSKLKNTTFEVVFIDSSPWLSRKHVFEYFKNKSKIILIHDFDYFPNKNLIGTVTYKEYLRRKNSTLIYEKIQIDMEPNFKLYYPPFEFFVGETGPPTLVFSKVLSKEEFDTFISIIDKNIPGYY